MNIFKKYNNIKYQLKKRYNKFYTNYKPYLYINNSNYIKDNKYKSILQSLLYYLPKNRLLSNKIYNITEKKNKRMGKGKGNISYFSTHYYGNKPIFLIKNVNLRKLKLLYIKHSFLNISRKHSIIDFK